MGSALRSFVAVIAGFLTMMVIVVVLTLLAVKVMHMPQGKPTAGYLAVNTVYSLVAASAGGWVTGRLGRPRSLQHGYVLGVVMAMMGVLSYLHYSGVQPLWYQLVMIVLPSFGAVVGAGLAGEKPMSQKR